MGTDRDDARAAAREAREVAQEGREEREEQREEHQEERSVDVHQRVGYEGAEEARAVAREGRDVKHEERAAAKETRDAARDIRENYTTAEEVAETEARARSVTGKRGPSVIVGVIVAAAVSVALAFGIAAVLDTEDLATKEQVRSNARLSAGVQAIVERLESCATSKGACYQEEQAQDAAQNGEINAITYLAVACADAPGHQNGKQIRRCVAHQLEAE